MPQQKLTDFLTDLAQPGNEEKLKRYLHSKQERDEIVDASSLSEDAKNALRNNNFQAAKRIVQDENPGSQVYLMPMGQHITTL